MLKLNKEKEKENKSTKKTLAKQFIQNIETSVFTTTEEELDTLEQMRLRDPLFSDKQFLVTHIYNSFTQLDSPVTTTSDFYRVGKCLGKGAFGKVNLAQHKLTGHFVAVKSVKKTDLED